MPTNLQSKHLTSFPEFPVSETHLILNNNEISTIPSYIIKATNLRHLWLSNNKISNLPPGLFKLKKLSVLQLGNNQISSIPSQIGELAGLIQLKLENNKLTELPKEIGLLTNLTHLYLDNNQITFLPEEIKNLKKLVHLSLNGNPIVLPDKYATNKAQETISFVLEHQSDLSIKDSQFTRKAYYFINASKDYIVQKYDSILKSFSAERTVDFIPISSLKDIRKDINIVFIINPLDVHFNEKLVLDIAEKCKNLEIQFYILTQKGFIEKDIESVNLSKGDVIERVFDQLQSQFSKNCNSYSSFEEFDNFIIEALKRHRPNIRLTNLLLQNIGHFNNLEIPLDNNLTCLIGENGTGKSTILRALALAIIGHNHNKIEEKVKRSFLKIQKYSEDNIWYNEGLIRLEYSIDGDIFYNELKFIPDDNGNDISIVTSGDFQIVYGKYNLKSLIVGFPQARGNDSMSNSDLLTNKISQPHINDLLPLLNNSDDFRLRSFAGWIANLYFESVKNKDNANERNKEDILISEAFNIISKITKKEINFMTVKAVDPPEVWVTTFDSPNGVPLYFVSQGFKIIIGWIGYFLQRFVNTFPLSDPKSAFKENSILIIDEVDTSIHPAWQSSFIDILRETFPNTQFILSTHSPLMIAGLNREQFIELSVDGDEIIALKNQIDTWSYSYRDILQKLFNTNDPIPKRTIEELQVLFSESMDDSEKESIKDNIMRLKESISFENDLALYEMQLLKKEKELDDLIEKYKKKIK